VSGAIPPDLSALLLDVLDNAPQHCQWHGQDFFRAGSALGRPGVPRCDSCKQPWRVLSALVALRLHVIGQDSPA
jgi:hypothetical protein